MSKNQHFAYAKTKTQISFAVTAKLISAFVFATWIVQSLYFLNLKFQASIYLLYSLVCVRQGWKPECWFSHDAAHFTLFPERATDGSQPSENWALYMEVCDVINETDEG